jgi:hypothetical protein
VNTTEGIFVTDAFISLLARARAANILYYYIVSTLAGEIKDMPGSPIHVIVVEILSKPSLEKWHADWVG